MANDVEEAHPDERHQDDRRIVTIEDENDYDNDDDTHETYGGSNSIL